ncbi:hypothetical protein DFJ74DRAFT_669513 [Hyaloraphidium curvatum]|nr:hypothetical protein DFJ74DRAFT_669513 [Hyaloraphidium curvatum]
MPRVRAAARVVRDDSDFEMDGDDSGSDGGDANDTLWSPRGGSRSSASAAPLPRGSSCEPCSRLKIKCEFAPGAETCLRCQRLKKLCVPRDPTTSRRQRERLAKLERRRRTSSDSAGTANPAVASRTGSAGTASLFSDADRSSTSLNSLSTDATLSGDLALLSATSDRPPSGPLVSPSVWDARPGSADILGDFLRPRRASRFVFPPPPQQIALSPPPPSVEVSAGGCLFLLPRLSILHTFRSLPDVLMRCTSTYWNHPHRLLPFVHRASFEQAFISSHSPIYGSKPLALLYAVAACGAFALPGSTGAERATLARALVERARELLAVQQTRDAEEAQACLLLVLVAVPLGNAAASFDILRRGLGAADRLHRSSVAVASPRSADEWIALETALRAWIVAAAVDLTFADLAGRDPLFDYFPSAVVRLPAHEVFFDDPSPDRAFATLHLAGDRTPSYAPVGGFLAHPDLPSAEGALCAFLGPAFAGRASVLSLLQASNMLQQHCCIRQPGGQPWLAAAEPEGPAEPAEVAMQDLVDAFFRCMPAEFGPALASGDAGPFLALSPAMFSHPTHAHAFLDLCASLRALSLRAAASDPAASGREFVRSPSFLRALEDGIHVARLLEARLRADPAGATLHFALAPAWLRAAAVNAAGVGVLRSEPGGADAVDGSAFGGDLRALAGAIELVGKNFGPVVSKQAANFRSWMRGLGVSIADPEDAAAVDDAAAADAPGDWGSLADPTDAASPPSLAELVRRADQAARAWVC